MDIWDAMEQYNGKEFTGTVRWFDGMSGEGMVRLDNGQSLYCHFTAIDGIDKHNYQWPTDTDQERLEDIAGKRVTVTPYITPGYVGCEKVVLIHE